MKDSFVLYGHGNRIGSGHSDLGDLFAINPIRRSLAVILVSLSIMALPAMFLTGEVEIAVLIVTFWFGCTGLIMCTPILIWSVIEEVWHHCQRRLWPTVDQLELSERGHNLLRRHGFVTIASVEQTPDTTMLLLSNMDGRVLHEIRRSISIWEYRRWQERGFR